MKNLVKKNQLMITALAIMIAIAGYLQFAGTDLEEEYLTVTDENLTSEVGSEDVIAEHYTTDTISNLSDTQGVLELSEEDLLTGELAEIESLDSDVSLVLEEYPDVTMESVLESNSSQLELAEATPEEGEIPGEAVFTSGTAVLSDAKLLKEQTRAKNKETLLEIINSTGLTDEQKQEAVNSMVEMTDYAEKEAAAEILLEAKGFSDVVVSVNGSGVDVVVNALELSDVQRVQIEDIVKRKTGVSAENIVISTVVQ